MALAEMEKPSEIGPDEVLIQIKSIGVCGSDVHYYTEGRIGSQVVKYPFLVGHECSGIVEKCGKNVSNVTAGDLVVVDPSIHCGTCDQCLAGRSHTCRNNRFLGCPGQIDGCLTEYIVMPAYTCSPVTGRLDATEAALIEPLSVGVYSVRLAGITDQGSRCAIFGAGPIGLSILMKLLADGISSVGVIEPLNYRLEKAKQIGAAWLVNPDGKNVYGEVADREKLLLDVVFDASGDQGAINNALEILKPGGKLVLVGIPVSAKYTFNMDLMRRKELTVINVRRQNHCVEEAIELVAGRKINVKQMVTHYFQLREVSAAFDVVAGYKDNVIKAMIFL
jgi:L-iditol 2-dehydrogenase